MKHIKFFAITIAMLATIIGCQQYDEDIDKPAITNDDVATLRAYAPGFGNKSADTKVVMNENEIGDIEVAWVLDDEISVYNASTKMKVGDYCVSSIDSDTGEASFEPMISYYDMEYPALDASTEYVAVYPASYSDDLTYYKEELRFKFGWWYTEMISDVEAFISGEMVHLRDMAFMSSAPFTPNQPISFSYDVAMLTIECTTPPYDESFEEGYFPGLTLYEIYQEGSEYYNYSSRIDLVREVEENTHVKMHVMIPASPEGMAEERTVSLVSVAESEVPLIEKTSSVPFRAGKRYMFTSTYNLADISASNMPKGYVWTIDDFDETAATAAEFEGLRAAIDAYSGENVIILSLPNLTALPEGALSNITGRFNVVATKVTTLGDGLFEGSENIAEVNLPSATTIGANVFNGVTSLRSMTLAYNARVASTDASCFDGVATNKINLSTHADNRNGIYFILADGSNSTAFNTINGQAEVPVTGVEVIIPGAELSGYCVIRKGESKQITVNVLPANATNKNFTVSVSGCEVEIDGNTATITAVSDINDLYGYLTVTTEEGNFKSWNNFAINELGYTIGMLYPNEENPIGVVFAINEDFSGGVIVSLDQPEDAIQWANSKGALSDANNTVRDGYDGLSGLECMSKIYASEAYYFDVDEWELTSVLTKQVNTFEGYPALEWVNNKNIAVSKSFDASSGYAKGVKGVWYLPSSSELCIFQLSSCGYNNAYYSDMEMEIHADRAREVLEKNKDLFDPIVNDLDYRSCTYWSSTPNFYVGTYSNPCCVVSRCLKTPYDVEYPGQPQHRTAYVRAFMNF